MKAMQDLPSPSRRFRPDEEDGIIEVGLNASGLRGIDIFILDFLPKLKDLSNSIHFKGYIK